MRDRGRSLLVLALAPLLGGAAPSLSIEPLGPGHAQAAAAYREIWTEEGERIVATLEGLTGFAFRDGEVEVVVSDTPPMTAYSGREMRLRAGYSPAYRRATFVHELGHLLALGMPRSAGIDDHRLLYLFLYDAWTDLYGRDFADRMVSIERRIGPAYESAWDWALAMTREQRHARLREMRVRLDYRPVV